MSDLYRFCLTCLPPSNVILHLYEPMHLHDESVIADIPAAQVGCTSPLPEPTAFYYRNHHASHQEACYEQHEKHNSTKDIHDVNGVSYGASSTYKTENIRNKTLEVFSRSATYTGFESSPERAFYHLNSFPSSKQLGSGMNGEELFLLFILAPRRHLRLSLVLSPLTNLMAWQYPFPTKSFQDPIHQKGCSLCLLSRVDLSIQSIDHQWQFSVYFFPLLDDNSWRKTLFPHVCW